MALYAACCPLMLTRDIEDFHWGGAQGYWPVDGVGEFESLYYLQSNKCNI